MRKTETRQAKRSNTQAQGQCVCGVVRIEIDVPAVWAWHDHSLMSRQAQGCAYATFVGCWKSRVRILKGKASISRFEDAGTRTARSFCMRCGTPLFYERPRAPKMVNIPRAIFSTRTGREPRYHLGLAEAPEWAWRGERLVPLKGFPGVMWERPGRKKKMMEGEFPGDT
ncbi:MAG TPA: GFA family protein [Rhizomicrobium sp.]